MKSRLNIELAQILLWFKSSGWFIHNFELSHLLETGKLLDLWGDKITKKLSFFFFLHKQKCGSWRQIKRLISLLRPL